MRLNTERAKLEIQRSARPFAMVIALCVAGLVALLLMFANLSFQRPWDHYREFDVVVADAKGTTPGHQPVRISGVDVGVVRDWRVEGDHAVLRVAIREQYARRGIFRNATARLRPVTPLQDMYVEFERGTPKAGVLPDGGRIPATQTVTPVDVSRVLNVFESGEREQLGNLIRGLGAGLDDNGARLRRAFEATRPFLLAARDLSSAIATRRRELARFVHSFGAIVAVLGTQDRQLARFVQRGDQTLATLARHEGSFGRTIEQLPGTVAGLRSSLAALARAEDELDPALRGLRPVAAQLAPGLAAVERLSGDATPALRKLTSPVSRLRPLARALDPLAADAQVASARLQPQTSALDTATRLVTRCERTFRNFFFFTMSIFKFGDANGANPRAEVSVGTDAALGLPKDPNLNKTRSCTTGLDQEDAG